MLKIKQVQTKYGSFLNLENDNFIRECLEKLGGWEIPTIEICKSHLKEDSHVIEVGAHIGTHTVPISKMCPKGVVFSFEMQRFIFQMLNSNVILNGCSNVCTYMEFVSDENKQDVFGDINYSGYTSINSGGISYKHIKSDVGYPINVVSLDDKFKNLNKLDLIKIDAEGHEVPILKGAMKLIDKFKPLILTEFDEKNKQELVDLLPNYNFENVSYIYTVFNHPVENLMYKATPKN
jgi:FkbM family methyltransferase